MKHKLGIILSIISFCSLIGFTVDLLVFEFKHLGMTDLEVIMNNPVQYLCMIISLVVLCIGISLIKNKK